jgi:hypothetical protein
MVTFFGWTCFDNCVCCNYNCHNECNYHFFEECELSVKYISDIEDACDCWLVLLPYCVFPLILDLISCPCRCCYKECYKKCKCTKINRINTNGIVNGNGMGNGQPGTAQSATTITQQPNKNNKNNKKNMNTDFLNLPPHYEEHYRDQTITIVNEHLDNSTLPVYQN